MSMFLDHKLLIAGVTAVLSLGGGTTAFSLRNVSPEQLAEMDAEQLSEHLSDGINEIVEIVTPMLHQAAESIGDLMHGIL